MTDGGARIDYEERPGRVGGGRVAHLFIDRAAKRNAIGPGVIAGLRDACAELAGDERLAVEAAFDQGIATHPGGAHAAVVEVDVETGDVTILRHVAVSDCGNLLEPVLAEVTMRPATNVPLEGRDAERMVRMLDHLEELDDVQQVYSNADISEEILAALA